MSSSSLTPSTPMYPLIERRVVSRMSCPTPPESSSSSTSSGELSTNKKATPTISFAFHIEGVLMRFSQVLYGARATLAYLHEKDIPFVLMTQTKEETPKELSRKLGIELDKKQVIPLQHPFYDMVAQYAEKNTLVLGGIGDSIREVAKGYGFKNVFTSWDLYQRAQYPHELHISAIVVLSNPRDWKLDSLVTMGLLLSAAGYLGTISPFNNNHTLPNSGYGLAKHPDLYWCDPDSTSLFKAVLESAWREHTEGANLLRTYTVEGPLPPPKVETTCHIKNTPENSSQPYGGGIKETVERALKNAGWPADDIKIEDEKPRAFEDAGTRMSRVDNMRGRLSSWGSERPVSFSKVDWAPTRHSLPNLHTRDLNDWSPQLHHPRHKSIRRMSRVEAEELGLARKRHTTIWETGNASEVSPMLAGRTGCMTAADISHTPSSSSGWETTSSECSRSLGGTSPMSNAKNDWGPGIFKLMDELVSEMTSM